MNFLAHAFLSGSDKEILLGNFIADSVKGTEFNRFTPGVQKGIKLHRAIDHFTDTHPVVQKSKERLRPVYRKFSGVIVDVFYDHFLAKNWNKFSTVSLEEYVDDVYSLMKLHYSILPKRSQQMLPYMIEHNWLVSYAQIEGIEKILTQMARRSTFESNMGASVKELRLYYDLFEEEFNTFFPELIKMAEEFINKP